LLMIVWLLLLPFIYFSSSVKNRKWQDNLSAGSHYYLF
jgi:hypothetical protein